MRTQGLTAAERRVCDAIAARGGDLPRELAAWVAIPTGHNHAPGLDAMRGAITTRLGALGAAVELHPGVPKPTWLDAWRTGAPVDAPADDPASTPPSAVCRRLVDGSARILIAGHLDTVFAPGGSFREMSIAPDGKTATGPGVVDMKGGLLVAVTALEALEEAGARIGWSFLLNSDEETGSYHSEEALTREAGRHDVGLALEPAMPGGELVVERFGSGQFLIEAFGRSAHVGRDFEKGVSATKALSRAVVAACDLADPSARRIVSVGPLRGGSATNAVPDYAAAWGNARFPTQGVADEIGAGLDALATAEDAMPRIAVRRSFNRPAKPLTPDVERLAESARACAEDLGQSLPFGRTGGVCDGNILQAAGLPTIDTVGVRGGGLHTNREWIDLSSLVERASLLAVLLLRLHEGRAPFRGSAG